MLTRKNIITSTFFSEYVMMFLTSRNTACAYTSPELTLIYYLHSYISGHFSTLHHFWYFIMIGNNSSEGLCEEILHQIDNESISVEICSDEGQLYNVSIGIYALIKNLFIRFEILMENRISSYIYFCKWQTSKGLSDSRSGAVFGEWDYNEGLKFGVFSYLISRCKCYGPNETNFMDFCWKLLILSTFYKK